MTSEFRFCNAPNAKKNRQSKLAAFFVAGHGVAPWPKNRCAGAQVADR